MTHSPLRLAMLLALVVQPLDLSAQDVAPDSSIRYDRRINPMTDTLGSFELMLLADSSGMGDSTYLSFRCVNRSAPERHGPPQWLYFWRIDDRTEYVPVDDNGDIYRVMSTYDSSFADMTGSWHSAVFKYPAIPAYRVHWRTRRTLGPSAEAFLQMLRPAMRSMTDTTPVLIQTTVWYVKEAGSAHQEVIRFLLTPVKKAWLRRWLQECGVRAAARPR